MTGKGIQMYDAGTINQGDCLILRDLAMRVADIAADPVMEERRNLWYKHHSLQPVRPMMLIFPEGSWVEWIPPDRLEWEGEKARAVEVDLLQRIYKYEHFRDDTVIEPEWIELAPIRDTGSGVTVQRNESTLERGSWGFVPIIRDIQDLERLHHPVIQYDEAEHIRSADQMEALFGDFLEVKMAGIKHISFHMVKMYTDWCGLENMMYDLIDRPEFVHAVLSFIEEGYYQWIQQLEDFNLLSLNNDNTYHSSGGNGYTDELPAPGFHPERVRTVDMWSSAESQEFHVVSPEMHVEYALTYEKRLLSRFGLNGYGCCEDLSRKLDDIFTIPNIRRISIAPFANVDICAPKLKGDYIFSWKPHPAHLIGDFNPDMIRDHIQYTLDVAYEHGNVLEIILKDTHTCEHHPDKFDYWSQICRELIKEY